MKKIIAIVLITLTVLFCFAGCKKKADKVAAVVTNAAGKVVAAVTNDDGNAVRDGAGNLIVVATDPDGNVLEDDNGEIATEQVIVDSFLEIGNRYEMPDYSIVIPDKWKNSNNNSHQALVLKEDGTENRITIVTNNDSSQRNIIDSAISSLAVAEGGVSGEETLTVHGDENGKLEYAYATVDGQKHYVGFITFTYNGQEISVFIAGVEDMTDKIDEIVAIANSIEFI